MTRRILKKPHVERDLVEHFSFIARDTIEPAERFLGVAQRYKRQFQAVLDVVSAPLGRWIFVPQ